MGKKKHRGSSGRWLEEHENDAWVQAARDSGYRSRAFYKLRDIDHRDQLLKPGQLVVDLGAAPGGWSQYAAEVVGSGGGVCALDLLAMEPLDGVTFIQGDFSEDAVLRELETALKGRPVDLVLSDMAPNISGIRSADQARAMQLAELALEFADNHLRPGGDLLVKVFQGEGIDEYRNALKQRFSKLLTRKPEASRDRSREQYFLARQRLAV